MMAHNSTTPMSVDKPTSSLESADFRTTEQLGVIKEKTDLWTIRDFISVFFLLSLQ
jgi:hypothetical protein